MGAAPSPLDVRPTTGLLKALADDTRLRIVALLSRGELCVCHIASALDITQPNASQHLTVLRNAGVVDSRRKATGSTTG
jgi:ArsR family transcriptional regulator